MQDFEFLARPGQPLAAHLEGVASRAEAFAAAFDSGAWGRLAGLWHDLGKYQEKFQRRVRGEDVRAEHSGAGAAKAMERPSLTARALAFAIAGHHCGLANLTSSDDGPTPLMARLSAERALSEAKRVAPADLLQAPLPSPPSAIFAGKPSKDEAKRRLEFWTRFLFSALVDADRLDSETVGDPDAAALRASPYATLAELRDLLETRLDSLRASASADATPSVVNAARERISQACLDAAKMAPGLFSLSVPTGGGKTLASMRFAFHHALAHRLRRVVVVIPYTSIIEQNARAYGSIFGAENVVEHHSNLDPGKLADEANEEAARRHEPATENWDAPIVVTTTVQFFESLFSNHPGRCRKLHNVAKSVVVLDEVQTLPPQFLYPIIDGLKELGERYGCSIVFSTATPPALNKRESLKAGFEPSAVRPIIADPAALTEELRRVRYELPADLDAPIESYDELARELAGHPRVLAIVHLRKDARELALLLDAAAPGEPLFHLSALMCPRHRTETLAAIRAALASGGPCRVVATQLVEAGVDLDFPVVYRALGGLDSMVQAGGRCNREGKMAEKGRVVLFRAPTNPPSGVPRQALAAAIVSLRADGGARPLDDPALQEEYFRRLYADQQLDAKGVQTERAEFNFATVAARFKLIEDGFTKTLVVPGYHADGSAAANEIRRRLDHGAPIGKNEWRALQQFSVNVYEKRFEELRKAGAVLPLHPMLTEGPFALLETHRNLYDERFGLATGDEPLSADPSRLVT